MSITHPTHKPNTRKPCCPTRTHGKRFPSRGKRWETISPDHSQTQKPCGLNRFPSTRETISRRVHKASIVSKASRPLRSRAWETIAATPPKTGERTDL